MKMIDGGILICQVQCTDASMHDMGIEEAHWNQAAIDLHRVLLIREQPDENGTFAVFHFANEEYVLTDLTYGEAVEIYQKFKLIYYSLP
jgi:hypothetical protein